jgi:hypothetical protein
MKIIGVGIGIAVAVGLSMAEPRIPVCGQPWQMPIPTPIPIPTLMDRGCSLFSKQASHAPRGAPMAHENHRGSLSGSASESQSFIDT